MKMLFTFVFLLTATASAMPTLGTTELTPDQQKAVDLASEIVGRYEYFGSSKECPQLTAAVNSDLSQLPMFDVRLMPSNPEHPEHVSLRMGFIENNHWRTLFERPGLEITNLYPVIKKEFFQTSKTTTKVVDSESIVVVRENKETNSWNLEAQFVHEEFGYSRSAKQLLYILWSSDNQWDNFLLNQRNPEVACLFKKID